MIPHRPDGALPKGAAYLVEMQKTLERYSEVGVGSPAGTAVTSAPEPEKKSANDDAGGNAS